MVERWFQARQGNGARVFSYIPDPGWSWGTSNSTLPYGHSTLYASEDWIRDRAIDEVKKGYPGICRVVYEKQNHFKMFHWVTLCEFILTVLFLSQNSKCWRQVLLGPSAIYTIDPLSRGHAVSLPLQRLSSMQVTHAYFTCVEEHAQKVLSMEESS